jgi:GNAT superfamily N-acetyltransferase
MTNLERMIALADQFFEAKSDPDQLVVDEGVIAKLKSLHPATMSEASDENGPIAWILLIPTTHQVMERFVRGEIGEKLLFDLSTPGTAFESIYLCSALVLPEHRGKGLATRLTIDAIQAIQRDHPIRELFVWAFSEEGKKMAESIAIKFHLPLYERTE